MDPPSGSHNNSLLEVQINKRQQNRTDHTMNLEIWGEGQDGLLQKTANSKAHSAVDDDDDYDPVRQTTSVSRPWSSEEQVTVAQIIKTQQRLRVNNVNTPTGTQMGIWKTVEVQVKKAVVDRSSEACKKWWARTGRGKFDSDGEMMNTTHHTAKGALGKQLRTVSGRESRLQIPALPQQIIIPNLNKSRKAVLNPAKSTRQSFQPDQIKKLQEVYLRNPKPTIEQLECLATETGESVKRIHVGVPSLGKYGNTE